MQMINRLLCLIPSLQILLIRVQHGHALLPVQTRILLLKDSAEKLVFTVEIRDEAGTLLQTLKDDAVPTKPDFWLKELVIDSSNPKTKRTLSGTPGNGDVKKYKISIKVTDAATAAPLTTADDFSLEVLNVNDLPTITGTPASTSFAQANVDATTGKIKDVAQGSVFNFKPVVVDVDNKMKDLTFTTRNLPEWMDLKIDTATYEPSLVNKANRPDNSDAVIKSYSGIQICVDDDADSAPAICSYSADYYCN